MIDFFKFSRRKVKIGREVLRRNNISLLILDERWNNLFINTEKTSEITGCEEKLKELLKEQARFLSEEKEDSTLKKKCMDRIIQLTPEAFDKNDENARNEMQACEKEIKRLNKRVEDIQQALEDMPGRIKETNIELLEHTVNIVYFKIRAGQKRVNELEKLIEETRTKLKEYIDEKESLSQDDSNIYSYFHDLIGAEELEKFDRQFFSE